MVPVLNAREALPRHVEGMKPWLNLVEEVVVVDSESADGSLDYLKSQLDLPHVRFLSHPPGLYPSWNYGISQLRSEYFFVATIGDTMPAETLRILLESAERLSTDVLVGLPRLVDGSGRALAKEWPLHRMVRTNGIEEGTQLSGEEWLGWALAEFPATLIGSSASNLYRTRFFQERPFPTDFGRIGDSAWAVMHAFEARWGVEPRGDSIFWVHGAPVGIEKQYARVIGHMVELALATVADAGLRSPEFRELAEGFRRRAEEVVRYHVSAAEYRELRERKTWSSWFQCQRIRRERRAIRRRTLAFRESARELLKNLPKGA